MRKFKTVEELEQERKEALGLIPFRMPVDKLILIYARQSTKNQAIKNRESALQQTEEQLTRALELGWAEVKRLLFIENQMKDGTVRSASGRLRIDEREGLNTVVLHINSGEAGAVMGRDVARFFRDEDLVGPVVFAKACKDHHVLVITDDYIYNFNDPRRGRDDYKKFIEEAQAAADFLEKHQKGVMLKNRARKAQRGEYWGHNVPAGLMLDETRTWYVPNPYWEEPVKDLFKRFRALGGDVNALRREIVGKRIFPDLPPEILARIGHISLQKVEGGYTIRSREGIIGILTNPAYIGDIYYNGRLVKKGAHTAIVDEEDFFFAFYRLSPTDLDGNPIERPEGVTKRYTQTKQSLPPIQTLLSGLRYDGTPMISTNRGPKTSVYASRDGSRKHYVIQDRSKITVHPDHARLNAARLDDLFSERIVYRAGQALRSANNVPSEQPLESARQAIHAQILGTLDKVEQEKNEQKNPLENLEKQMAETKARIAEKDRITEFGTSAMDETDLKRHFQSLKNLRLSLAEMEKKIDQMEKEKQDKAEAKNKLPAVYTTWDSMDMEEKQRFIRVATSEITLDEIATGWFKLSIAWAPLLNNDIAGETLIDEAYVFSPKGCDSAWTEEELLLLKEHYATAPRSWLMEAIHQRSWNAIRRMAQKKNIIGRPNVRRSGKEDKLSLWLSVSDIQFLRDEDICTEAILAQGVVWKEYIDKEKEYDMDSLGNSDGLYSQSKNQA